LFWKGWVLPPASELSSFHEPLNDTCMMSLRGTQKILAIHRGVYIIVSDIAIVGTSEKVGQASRGSKSVSWNGMGQRRYSFNGVSTW
jgi:hypothetical protein